MVGIWLVGIDENTVVWTANRDDPLVTSNARTLDLTESGKLLLTTDEEGEEKIISATMSESASYACMFDSGNFVVALFINSYCQRQKLPLRHVRRDTSQNTVAFFKVA